MTCSNSVAIRDVLLVISAYHTSKHPLLGGGCEEKWVEFGFLKPGSIPFSTACY